MTKQSKSRTIAASQAEESDREERPRRPTATFHFTWQRFGEYRVVAELADHSAMLITLARSREEAAAKAEGFFREEIQRRRLLLQRATCKSGDHRDEIVSVFVERWQASPAGGVWEVLNAGEGGFCRQFWPIRRWTGRRCRQDGI